MKKKISIILISIILLSTLTVFVYFTYVGMNSELFSVHKELLTRKTIRGSRNLVEIYYVNAGATTDNALQVVKTNSLNNDKIVKNVEGYSVFKEIIYLIEENIQLVVQRSNNPKSTIDTINVSFY